MNVNDSCHLDHEALKELREVMEEEFDVLISTFLQDSADRIVHLRQALSGQEVDTFTKAAHSLKGSCINIGAPLLGELCLAAEAAGRAGNLQQGQAQVEAIEQEFRHVDEALRAYLQQS
ncbi:MAG: Hpt domain-containing protein [Oleiphilaceae bacterium]|nr:Hpt domain-containing protein [Oleiphilaceae bacterium]